MRVGTERHLVCIEDPFETSHDLGRTVGPAGADRLKAEFRLAWRTLREAPDAGARLFAPAPDDRPLWDGPGGSGGGGGRGSGGGGRGGTPRAAGRR